MSRKLNLWNYHELFLFIGYDYFSLNLNYKQGKISQTETKESAKEKPHQ
jgi:hypothetical protein